MDRSVIDHCAAGDHGVGRNIFFRHPEERGSMSRKGTDFLKSVRIHQFCYALARCEFPGRMLFLDTLRASRFFNTSAFGAKFAELLFYGRWLRAHGWRLGGRNCLCSHASPLFGTWVSGNFGERAPELEPY
jgi:hypothetical protein